MNTPYVFKRCSKCGEIKLATNEYFRKTKRGKYGLRSMCRICDKEYHKKWCENNKEYYKEYHKNNKEYHKEYHKEWCENNKEHYKEYHKEYYENNKEHRKEYSKKWRENNKEYYKEYYKEYHKNNKEHRKEYYKKYYKNNKEHYKEYSKKYYKNNKEHYKELYKEYYKSERGQVVHFNSSCRRRTKEQNQGNGITSEQWLECMKFFKFRCAYSGQVLSKDTRSLDHIKPLNQGGKHEIWNLVPMDRGLNSSKQDKDLLEWYREQDFYSEERLQKIHEWQEYAFNKYSKK